MVIVREYVDETGHSPFRAWFNSVDRQAAIKVTVALERIANGQTSAMKALGEGVSEYRIDFGPGYRIYFGKDGERLVILVGGGTRSGSHAILPTPRRSGRTISDRNSRRMRWP